MGFQEQYDSGKIDDKVTNDLAAQYNRINVDTIRWDEYSLAAG